MSAIIRERRGAIELLIINRPAALNAIDPSVLDGLEAAILELRDDASVRAVVVSGAGEKAFVAGADIAAMQSLSAIEAEKFAARGQAVTGALASLRVPVIAAVQGFALGGGCELAMACDLVIAGPKAKFGQPEVKLGVIPGFGGTQRLVRRAGLAVALDLCLTGRVIGAEEALRVGIVSRVVEGDVLEAAVAVANEVAAMGPIAVQLCKRVLHDHADGALDAGLAAERSAFALCFSTSDQREGMAAFLQKRPAQFVGR